MNKQWKTHKGDEWWYADTICEAEGWLNPAFPIHLEIIIGKMNNKFTEEMLLNFLIETQKEFPDCQLWLILNPKLKQMIIKLNEINKLDWEVIKNPLSESAHIKYIHKNLN